MDDVDDIKKYVGKKTKLIKNKKLFLDDYSPKTIINRSRERDKLGECLADVLDKQYPCPTSMAIYGSSGTGKSLLVSFLLDVLQQNAKEMYPDRKLKIIRIKASEVQTRYRVINRIYKGLYGDVKGPHDYSEIHDAIIKYLQTHSGQLYVFLDEIHEFDEKKELNHVIYTVSRLSEDVGYTPKPTNLSNNKTCMSVGFITISNNAMIESKLKDNTKSTYQKAERIFFNKYNSKDIFEILQERINEGVLMPDVFEKDGVGLEGGLKLIASLSAENEFDARFALHLLHQSAKLSEKKGKSCIGEDEIKEANTYLKENMLKSILEECNEIQLEILDVVYKISKKKNPEEHITSKNIFDEMNIDHPEFYVNHPALGRISKIFSRFFFKNDIFYSYNISGRRGQSRGIGTDETIKVVEEFLSERDKMLR